MGTPKTLDQAILNAMSVSGTCPDPKCLDCRRLRIVLRMHVIDFLSQKFNVEILREGADSFGVLELYKKIIVIPEGSDRP